MSRWPSHSVAHFFFLSVAYGVPSLAFILQRLTLAACCGTEPDARCRSAENHLQLGFFAGLLASRSWGVVEGPVSAVAAIPHFSLTPALLCFYFENPPPPPVNEPSSIAIFSFFHSSSLSLPISDLSKPRTRPVEIPCPLRAWPRLPPQAPEIACRRQRTKPFPPGAKATTGQSAAPLSKGDWTQHITTLRVICARGCGTRHVAEWIGQPQGRRGLCGRCWGAGRMVWEALLFNLNLEGEEEDWNG